MGRRCGQYSELEIYMQNSEIYAELENIYAEFSKIYAKLQILYAKLIDRLKAVFYRRVLCIGVTKMFW